MAFPFDSNAEWWREAVIYQIYPRSFQDTNGDGVGDLEGIRRRLDYLASLGVDAIWISPIFPSPMADFGYDISDYVGVDPMFGELADFDRLLAAAHERGLRVILDYVPNHTSNQHPWFLESRASRESPKRDWYIWRDAAPAGGPPNNWISEFGGPAWAFDQATGQYYMHTYLPEQPELNWRNPAVVEAMHDVLRFWFDRGVDGFRVDAIHHLFKDARLRDNPPNPEWREGQSPVKRLIRQYTVDQPEVHDAIAAMRSVAMSYGRERLLIGELHLPFDRMMPYYGKDLGGFHMPFNFHLMSVAWTPVAVAALVRDYEAALPEGAWPNWVLGNHDKSRIATRVGARQVRVAAMLLLTLRGTPTIYQGEEIGMADVAIPPERVSDPFEKNAPGFGRDPERTPMQWTAGPNAGFSDAQPWLPLADNYQDVNVAEQWDNKTSSLSLYRALLALRKSKATLSLGDYKFVAADESVFAFERWRDEARALIILNFRDEPASFALRERRGSLLLSTLLDRVGEHLEGVVRLRANEGVVVDLTRT